MDLGDQLARRRPITVAHLARVVRPQLSPDSARTPTSASAFAVESLVALAEVHGVVGLLPDEQPWVPYVLPARAQAKGRHVRLLHDLGRIQEAFEAVGVPWVLMKGAVLAHELYPRPDVRPFADADILVPPSRFDEVLDAMTAAGATCLVRNWDRMLSLRLAEITLVMPAGTQVDLHWSLANRAEVRDDLGFVTDELLRRSRPTSLMPGLRTLDDVDTLIHVAWHCTRAGATRMLWLIDVDLAAARVLDGTDDVQRRAAATGTNLAVGVALDRAAILFPGGAAEALAARLADGWWRRLNRVGGRWITRRSSGVRSGKALARATRSGQLQSAFALRVPKRGGPSELGASLGDDRGGPAGRGTYLRWVQANGR